MIVCFCVLMFGDTERERDRDRDRQREEKQRDRESVCLFASLLLVLLLNFYFFFFFFFFLRGIITFLASLYGSFSFSILCRAGLLPRYCLNLGLSWTILVSPSMFIKDLLIILVLADICGLLECARRLSKIFLLLESVLRNLV